jgi:hypothetical protein
MEVLMIVTMKIRLPDDDIHEDQVLSWELP